jgi:hypothetical protein
MLTYMHHCHSQRRHLAGWLEFERLALKSIFPASRDIASLTYRVICMQRSISQCFLCKFFGRGWIEAGWT